MFPTIRRLFLATLVLCLLALQQDSVLHAWEHRQPAHADSLAGEDHAADELCALCLAFGGLGAALVGSPPRAAVADSAGLLPAARPAPIFGSGARAYIARAPPYS